MAHYFSKLTVFARKYPSLSYWIAIILAAIISFGGYLASATITYRLGYPLDDAWIHQTYARNLAILHQWAFIPGKTSAGATSPLWVIILAIGYYLRVIPFVWTYLVGFILLIIVAYLGREIVAKLYPNNNRYALFISLFLVFEWHIVWAAASGMETILFIFLILLIFFAITRDNINWIITGLLVGICVWIRPEGITLLPVVLLTGYFSRAELKSRIFVIVAILLGTVFILLPYFWFNLSISGNLWPNTFFAKRAEYAAMLQIPLPMRLFKLSIQPMVGAGILLLPGFVFTAIKNISRRQWNALAFIIWIIGDVVLYSWQLPVTYQHARYLIPIMPVYFLISLAGVFEIWSTHYPNLLSRVLVKSWMISTLFVLLGFWVMGANAYGKDVAFIESEMVDTSRWISNHIEPESIVAAHDIGALGYYGNHTIIDLAGLVSPEVIPFIRDEQRMKKYLDDKHVNYLMTFPGWYPYLVKYGVVNYQSYARFSPMMGGENMVVYAWGSTP